ncbi:O-antigen ligase [Georgenia soli]|uniref:O-antigen ligase n=1 Tax=Georgenia soli TaxID=638953 RepID=A0A2A9ELI6_9MICO|nr:O-antigen ligase [Georgenia soli]
MVAGTGVVGTEPVTRRGTGLPVLVLSLGLATVPSAAAGGSVVLTAAAVVLGAVVAAAVAVRLRLSLVELLVVALPVHFYPPGRGSLVNLSLADGVLVLMLLAAAGRAALQRRSPRGPAGPTWPLLVGYTVVLQLVLWASLVGPVLLGGADFPGGAAAAVKIALACAYLLVLYAAVAPRVRAGDRRVLEIWAATATASALIGIGASALYAAGVDLGLSYFWRASGTFEDPNAFSVYLLLSLGVVVAAHRDRTGRPWSWQVPVIVVAVVLTGSRAAMAAMALAAVVTVVLTLGTRAGPTFRRLLVGTAVLGVLAVVILPDAWVGEVLQRATSVFVPDAGAAPDQRYQLWSVAVQQWASSPVLGVGAGQYVPVAQQLLGPQWDTIPHNTYLGFLAETGIVGLLVFLVVPALVVTRLLRATRAGDGDAPYLLLSVLALLMQAFTLSLENTRPMWAVLGLMLALYDPGPPGAEKPPGPATVHGRGLPHSSSARRGLRWS